MTDKRWEAMKYIIIRLALVIIVIDVMSLVWLAGRRKAESEAKAQRVERFQACWMAGTPVPPEWVTE